MPSDTAPLFAVASDLNGDGRDDLVLGNADATSVSIRFALGDGSTGATANYLVGFGLQAATVADLDGDGLPEVVAVVSNGARVLMNLGDGTFGSPVEYPTQFQGASVAVADMNHDCAPDLVIGTQGGNVDVRLNLGDGLFSTPTTYFVGATTPPLQLADLNADDAPDLVSVSSDDNSIYIAFGRGDGTFAPANALWDPFEPRALAVGDLNGDGHADLAIGDLNSLGVYLNRGDGTFEEPTSFPDSTPLRTNPNSVLILDLDADGANDVVFQGWNEMAAFMNTGAARFRDPLTYAVGGPSMISADLNGDCRPELLVPSADGVFVVPVEPPAGIIAPPRFDAWREISLAAADFDGDGDLDLVRNSLRTRLVRVTFNDGRASLFGEALHLAAFDDPAALQAVDVNQDGWPDVVTANGEPDGEGTMGVLLNLGGGLFEAPQIYPTGTSRAAALVSADFDQDGRLDFAIADSLGNGVSVLRGDGEGGFGAPSSYPVGAGPVALSAADLDGDGYPDLAVAYADGVALLLNEGDGSMGAPEPLPALVGPADDVVALDIEGDGKVDLAVASASGVSTHANHGDAVFVAGVTYRVGSGWHRLAAIEVDAGGGPDLAVTNFRGTSVSLLVNDAKGGFHPARSYPAGQGALTLVTGDFDGDEHGDVILSLNDDSMSVLLNTCR